MERLNNLKYAILAVVAVTLCLPGVSQTDCFTCDQSNRSSLGEGNTVTGANSTAIGTQSSAKKHTSFAVGYGAEANGLRSVALGSFSYAADYAYALGQYARSVASNSFTFGNYVESTASGAFAIGYSSSEYKLINNKLNSLMIGFGSKKPTLFVGPSPYTINHDATGNVGIGTSEPATKLQVASGDVFVEDINSGIIMKSLDGRCWRGTLTNGGMLAFSEIACPGGSGYVAQPAEPETLGIRIYPNPADGRFTIESSRLLNHGLVNIYTTDGKLVREISFEGLTLLQTERLLPGVYIVSITENGRLLKSQQEVVR